MTRVPLDYRRAAGGRFVGDDEGRADGRNPIGPGGLQRDATRIGRTWQAPQIEAPGEAMADPFGTPEPRGFGPVPPFWAWRERHLGTRDEAWQKERMPQMPADLSYSFFQTAHPDLIVPYLRGTETLRLEGLVPGGGTMEFTLPGVVPVAHHAWFDGRQVTARLMLDGLHLDFRAPEGPWQAHLTWRGWVMRCPAYHGARLDLASVTEAANLAVSGEYGLAEPQTEPWAKGTPDSAAVSEGVA